MSFHIILSGSPENWVTMNGNYSGKYFYRNINGKYSFTEAKQFCEGSGAKLAEPLDKVNNQNLSLMFSEFEGKVQRIAPFVLRTFKFLHGF